MGHTDWRVTGDDLVASPCGEVAFVAAAALATEVRADGLGVVEVEIDEAFARHARHGGLLAQLAAVSVLQCRVGLMGCGCR